MCNSAAMSISTRTGDEGTTSLMYGRRVPKSNPRTQAYGTIDELTSHLGMARALSNINLIQGELFAIQKNLVPLMGELAVAPEDTERYAKDRYPKFSPNCLAHLDSLVQQIEAQNISFEGWATPGSDAASAALDIARTVCRRAERVVHHLSTLEPVPALSLAYLNRLSDVLWLMARLTETELRGL